MTTSRQQATLKQANRIARFHLRCADGNFTNAIQGVDSREPNSAAKALAMRLLATAQRMAAAQ